MILFYKSSEKNLINKNSGKDECIGSYGWGEPSPYIDLHSPFSAIFPL
jgi:hypothetical protein